MQQQTVARNSATALLAFWASRQSCFFTLLGVCGRGMRIILALLAMELRSALRPRLVAFVISDMVGTPLSATKKSKVDEQ